MIVSDYFPHVIFTLNIWTPELSAIVILKYQHLERQNAVSDLGLDCLLRFVSPNTVFWNKTIHGSS